MRFPRTLSTALVFLALMIPLGFPGMGLVGLFVVGVRRKRRKGGQALGALLLVLVMTSLGCGAHRETVGTPLGTSTVTVTGSTTNFTHTTTFKLTVN